MFDLPIEGKFAGIRRFHTRGNILFGEGQFHRASVQYRAALVWFDYTFPTATSGPFGQDALDAIRVRCLTNLAACEIHLRQWTEAAQTARLALAADPSSVKARYRRATARRHLHDFDGALQDIDAAIALEPGSGALRKERATILLARREYERRSRLLSRGMLHSSSSSTSAVAGHPSASRPETALPQLPGSHPATAASSTATTSASGHELGEAGVGSAIAAVASRVDGSTPMMVRARALDTASVGAMTALMAPENEDALSANTALSDWEGASAAQLIEDAESAQPSLDDDDNDDDDGDDDHNDDDEEEQGDETRSHAVDPWLWARPPQRLRVELHNAPPMKFDELVGSG